MSSDAYKSLLEVEKVRESKRATDPMRERPRAYREAKSLERTLEYETNAKGNSYLQETNRSFIYIESRLYSSHPRTSNLIVSMRGTEHRDLEG